MAGSAMVEDFSARANPDEVAIIYLGIVAAAAGHTPTAIRAALSMALTLLGEQHGLSGPALLDWIDTIAATARLAARTDASQRGTH